MGETIENTGFCRVLWYNICMENRETQTSNTEEMVTISRAEYERFQEQAQVITGLTLQNEWLLEQLKLSTKSCLAVLRSRRSRWSWSS